MAERNHTSEGDIFFPLLCVQLLTQYCDAVTISQWHWPVS